jgi:hypothetical protein
MPRFEKLASASSMDESWTCPDMPSFRKGTVNRERTLLKVHLRAKWNFYEGNLCRGCIDKLRPDSRRVECLKTLCLTRRKYSAHRVRHSQEKNP